MKTSKTFTMLILGAMFLLVPAHGVIFATHFRGGTIYTMGSGTMDNGTLITLGQSAIGLARSTTHRMNAGVIPVIVQLSTSTILWGDIDGDGDVDEDDYFIFTACMHGPDVEYVSLRRCSPAQFDLADIQHDNDVDMEDYRFLSLSFMAP